MPSQETPHNAHNLDKAALRGEPSYVWRDGQQRRLALILEAAGERAKETVLVDGCGVGMYLHHLEKYTEKIVGLDIEFERLQEAKTRAEKVVNARGEDLPFQAETFDLVLSHEVLEHVQDDRAALSEIVRSLKPGGRLVLFCPNRGYPFETHGFYWRGGYHFGNIPMINYLPRTWRDRLAPHVNVYSRRDLERLFAGLPIRYIQRTTIFGAYDNIIARFPRLGKGLRAILQWLERTPLRCFGLSHFWVVEKTQPE
jgi:SAM-dependent methyltransferase